MKMAFSHIFFTKYKRNQSYGDKSYYSEIIQDHSWMQKLSSDILAYESVNEMVVFLH